MTLVKVTAILPKHNPFDIERMRKAIENAGKESAKAVEVDFNVTTRTWNHKPDFKIRHQQYIAIWEISTDDEVYGYVDAGTRPHIIKVKNARFLHFYRTGFRAKSRAGWIGSNKGKAANKDETFVKSVSHPGNQPRNFAKTIQKKWATEWPRQLARAIRAAAAYG